jgi:hypothetical protein
MAANQLRAVVHARIGFTNGSDDIVEVHGIDLPTHIHHHSKIWQMMSKVCRDTKFWTCVKPFQRTWLIPSSPCALFGSQPKRPLSRPVPMPRLTRHEKKWSDNKLGPSSKL